MQVTFFFAIHSEENEWNSQNGANFLTIILPPRKEAHEVEENRKLTFPLPLTSSSSYHYAYILAIITHQFNDFSTCEQPITMYGIIFPLSAKRNIKDTPRNFGLLATPKASSWSSRVISWLASSPSLDLRNRYFFSRTDERMDFAYDVRLWYALPSPALNYIPHLFEIIFHSD